MTITTTSTTIPNKNILRLLWLLCIVGVWSILPYAYYMGILPPESSIWEVGLLGTVQAGLLYAFICWACFKLLPKTDLRPFPFLQGDDYLKKLLYPALIYGMGVGLCLRGFDHFFFDHLEAAKMHPPFWVGLLACIYGAVNEEVLTRLFLFTLIYFLVGKCIHIHAGNRVPVLWAVTFAVALGFGLGHLPAAFALMPLSAADVFRILSLNALAGSVFGYLYWSKGFWTAMAAHFFADLMLHVLLP